jgi:hypothetical protein
MTVKIVKVGLKDAADYIDPFVTAGRGGAAGSKIQECIL